MRKKVFYIVAFIVSVIVLGYLRETFFVRVKWCEAVLDGASRPAPFPLYNFLDSLDRNGLQLAKYLGTIFFIFVFLGLSLFMVKLFFEDKKNYRIVQTVFGAAFTLGVLAYLLGYVLPYHAECYEVSRWIIGVIETPLILFMLFPLFWISAKNDQWKNGN